MDQELADAAAYMLDGLLHVDSPDGSTFCIMAVILKL